MSSHGPTGDSREGSGGAIRWCCYLHEIPQKPSEGAGKRYLQPQPILSLWAGPVSQKNTGRTP